MNSIVGIINSYSSGTSGGDQCFINFFSGLTDWKKIIITSELGKKYCTENGIKNGQYLITTAETNFSNVYKTYIYRIIRGINFGLKINDFDLIYSSSDFLPDVLVALILKVKNPKKPYVQKIFHIIPTTRISGIFQRISLFIIKHFADLIIVDNPTLLKELESFGLNASKIKVNYPGIDYEYIKQIKPSEDLKTDLIFVGRIQPTKGLEDMFVVLKNLKLKLPKITLGIVGKGDPAYFQELKDLCTSYGLDGNVKWLGFLSVQDKYSALKSSRIFVFPSYEEGFGMVMVEALMAGLPVLAYELPHYASTFPDLLNLVELGNKSLFEKTLLQLLNKASIDKSNPKNLDVYTNESYFVRELNYVTELLKDKKI